MDGDMDAADSTRAPRDVVENERVPDRARLVLAVVRSIGFVVATLVGYALIPFRGDAESYTLRLALVSVVLGVIVVAQVRAVLRAAAPVARAIEGLTVSTSLLVVTFAAIYLVISGNDVGAFSEELDHVDALYLAMMTATTVGFGDISSVTAEARIAVMAQMVVNIVVIGTVGRLLFTVARQRRSSQMSGVGMPT